MKKLNSLLTFLLLAVPGYSQEVEMADTMRSEGKIYVVVSVILAVMAGLIGYLIYIDRKTSRLEQKMNQNRPS